MKERLSQGFSHLFNGAKLLFHPFMPTIKIIFKKYLGKYFNEQLLLDQMSGMGLRNLTLKTRAVNESLNPAIPFVVERGSIGQIKLDLKQFTMVLDRIDITLRFKTPEQLLEFGRNYQRMQLNAMNLEKLKEDCMKNLIFNANPNLPQSENAADLSWGVIKQILSKVKISVTNVCIRLVVPLEQELHLSLLISGCQLRMRKVSIDSSNKKDTQYYASQPQQDATYQPPTTTKESNTSLTATLILGGISLHLSEGDPLPAPHDPFNFLEQTCIMSMYNQYNSKKQVESHLVIHLKVDVKERLKFSSTLQMKQIEFSLSRKQFILVSQIVTKFVEVKNSLSSKEKKQKAPDLPGLRNIISQTQEDEDLPFTWSKSSIRIPDYWDRQGQQQSYINNQPSQTLIIEPESLLPEQQDEVYISIEDNNHLENISFIESEFNQSTCSAMDQCWGESTIASSEQIDTGSAYLPQPSFYQESVCQRNLSICHEEKGLDDLHSGNLILFFSLDLITVTIRHRENEDPLNKEGKWLYSFTDQTTKKNHFEILDILNPQTKQDHFILAMQSFEVKMEKQALQILGGDDTKTTKFTKIRIDQINLLDIRVHIFNKLINKQEVVEEPKESEESCEDSFSVGSFKSNYSDTVNDAVYASVADSSQVEQTPSHIARIVECCKEFQDQLNEAKNRHFLQDECMYFTVQKVCCINPQQNTLNDRELVKCLKIHDGMMVFLLQPDQKDIQFKVPKQPAIRITIRPQASQSSKMQIFASMGDVSLLTTLPQLKILKQLCTDMLPSPNKASKQQTPTNPSNPIIILNIDALEACVLLQDPNMVELYFIQTVHSQLLHHNNSAFRFQLSHKLQQCALSCVSLKMKRILCEHHHQSTTLLAFKELRSSFSYLDLQCIQSPNLQLQHQNILQIESKPLENEKHSGIKTQYAQALLQPLLKIHEGKICLTVPLLTIYVEGGLTQHALSVSKFIQDLLHTNISQESTNSTDTDLDFNVFFDEAKIICLEGQPRLIFNDKPVKVDCQSHQPQFVTNFTQEYTERMGIHMSKLNASYRDKQVELVIYNCVVWDSATKAHDDEPVRYGSFFQSSQPSNQLLKFRSASYDAQSVLVYKQERSNVERFKHLISNDKIFSEIEDGTLTISQTDQLLNPMTIDQLYIHPDNVLTFKQDYQSSCIVSLTMNAQKSITVGLRHVIVSCDQHLQNTIPYMLRLAKHLKPPHQVANKSNPNTIKVQWDVSNLWLSLFPTYNRQALLQQFVQQKCKFSELSSHPNVSKQFYYSWIRSVVVISDTVITLHQSQNEGMTIVANLQRVHLYMKKTSCPNLPFSNPVLLIQPSMTIYKRNRRESDAYQIDNNKLALLQIFNFQKIGTLNDMLTQMDVTALKQIKLSVQLGRGKFTLKRDSLDAALTLVHLLRYNLKSQTSTQDTPSDHLNPINRRTLNIFEQVKLDQDIIQEPPRFNTLELTVSIKNFNVSLYQGYHFSTEVFTILNDKEDFGVIDEAPTTKVHDQRCDRLLNIIGQEIYHLDYQESQNFILEAESNIDQHDQQQQQQLRDNVRLCIVDAECTLAIGPTHTFTSRVGDVIVEDNIKKSRFTRIFCKESLSRAPTHSRQHMIELSYCQSRDHKEAIPTLNVTARIYPLRFCIYGATLEFLLNATRHQNQWETPKVRYIKQLEAAFHTKTQVAMTDAGCLNQQAIIKAIEDIVKAEGYIISFPPDSHHQTPFKVNQLIIHETTLTITYDGSGILLDTLKKGMMRIASYDNLVLHLKQSVLRDEHFNTQHDLLNLLVEQYIQYVQQNKEFRRSLFLHFKGIQNVSQIYFGFRAMITSSIQDGIIVGLSTGSVPFMRAIVDELIFLAKKPIDVCESVTEGIGLQPVAERVIRPIGVALQNIGNRMSSDSIPIEFLK